MVEDPADDAVGLQRSCAVVVVGLRCCWAGGDHRDVGRSGVTGEGG